MMTPLPALLLSIAEKNFKNVLTMHKKLSIQNATFIKLFWNIIIIALRLNECHCFTMVKVNGKGV